MFAAIYEPMLSVFGLRSYLPYIAVLAVMHATAAVLLFRLIRRRSGSIPALICSAVVLFLGNGADDYFWAFQIGFLGSIIGGLSALPLLDRPEPGRSRLVGSAAAMVVIVMSSGVGLFFCVAIAVDLILDRARRSSAKVVAVPVLVYGAWFLVFGPHGGGSVGSSPLAARLLELPGYVFYGLGAGFAAAAGQPAQFAPVALMLGSVGLFVFWWRRRRPDTQTIGLLAGVTAFFASAGLLRGDLGVTQSGSARYVYVAAYFLLPVLAMALAEIPWRGLWRPLVAFGVLAVLGFNALWLHRLQVVWDRKVAYQNADLSTALVFRDSRALSRDADIDPELMPLITPQGLLAATDELGSPLATSTLQQLLLLPSDPVNRTVDRLFVGSIRVATGGPDATDSCYAAAHPGFTYVVDSGRTLHVISSAGGVARLYLWLSGDSPPARMLELRPTPSVPLAVTLPDLGPNVQWKARVEGAQVCPT